MSHTLARGGPDLVAPRAVILARWQASTDVRVGNEHHTGSTLSAHRGADRHRMHMHSIANKIHAHAWVRENGFHRSDGPHARIGFLRHWEHIIEMGRMHCAGINGRLCLLDACPRMGYKRHDTSLE